jgi:tetratricopeptide (TPR) repeat protein
VPSFEARIADLRTRVDREPGSRYFVPLADEYRRAGRLPEAIATLEAGLKVHEGYVSARIALGRAYLEAGRIDDSVAAFSRALADDPSNLVAAKALGDLHASRGESVDALRRYLLYRGISGDRRLDATIARLQAEIGPRAEAPPPVSIHPPAVPTLAPEPPPPIPRDLLPPPSDPLSEPVTRQATDPAIEYQRPSRPIPLGASEEPEVVSRDASFDALAAPRRDDEEIVTRKIRLPEAMWPHEPAPVAIRPPEPAEPPRPETPPEPQGRTLAELYLEQGHYPEALAILQDLVAADPRSAELARLRNEAERRAASTPPPGVPAADPGRERRLAKISVLNQWLAVIRTAASNGRVR